VTSKHKGLKLTPTKLDELFYMSEILDSSFGEDKDTRLSVFGYALYFCGAPEATKSKSGRSVSLSELIM
jgi:hypothetical protein